MRVGLGGWMWVDGLGRWACSRELVGCVLGGWWMGASGVRQGRAKVGCETVVLVVRAAPFWGVRGCSWA